MPHRFPDFHLPDFRRPDFRRIAAIGPALRKILSLNRASFALSAAMAILPAAPAEARDNLGMYDSWGAFHDPAAARCYAIAMAAPNPLRRDYQPYATVGTWPKQGVRNQVHFRLSRKLAGGTRIVLRIGRDRFELTGGGGDAWAADKRMDVAIVTAMRSAESMTVYARGANGRPFFDSWPLAGAATAMDAATVACAKLR